ncbi:ADOP family duplicated permease [Silvibacterium acidisoli]|uniref:ADOP family duplicated permease n=1 Tax=Acidobacteriaceae bacterium ZG23-2 TaxID=2883246 RepID=UPI00406CA5E0
MRALRAFFLRFLGTFRNKNSDDISAELDAHLAMHIEDGMRAGLSAEEARRQALIRLGGIEQTRNAYSERRSLPSVESLWRDVVYGVRTLLKNPGFTVAAVLIIAIGIGANIALFTIVRSVLLRPLPYPDPQRLVTLYSLDDPSDPASQNVVAPGDFRDWQSASSGFEQMAMWRWAGFNISGNSGELPEFLNAAAVSSNFFTTLGVQPALGRSFNAGDDLNGAAPVTILSWSLFKRRFHADPAILGTTVKLNTKQQTVVGVLPPWIDYPSPKVQVWVPFAQSNTPDVLASHYAHVARVVARLKPGVSAERALEPLNAVQHQLFLRFNGGGPVEPAIGSEPMIKAVVGNVETPLHVLMAAVGCLLLIACLNLSNLLVARAAARRKEIAIRTALGSSRLRLCREQLTESLLISLAGGALGVLLATGATHWLTTRWTGMPRATAIHPDWTVLFFALGVTFAVAILSGLLPAISTTGKDSLAALQDSSRSVAGSTAKARLRKTMLTAEIALTVILLVCAGLLFKSFLLLRSTDLGCARENVLTMHYFLRGEKYAQPEQLIGFHTRLLERVRHLPGVEAAGLTNVVPGGGLWGDKSVEFPEHPPLPAGQHELALVRTADPGYFQAMQIPLLEGRTFEEQERLNRDQYLVVNQSFVKKFFPNEDPIGKHVKVPWRAEEGENYEIIGVIRDTPYDVGEPVRPAMWFPILSGIPSHTNDAILVVRSRSDVAALAIPVQKAIAELDPDLPLKDVLTVDEIVGESTANSSFSAILVLVFAALSLLLAAVGLYGVLAYLVTQRTSEIGIRMALGARREQVLRLMLFDGLRPAFIGLGVGIAGSFAVTQWIRSSLYGTHPLDPAVYVTVSVTLLLASVCACVVPAWRATRTDPTQALRNQ